MPPTPDHSAASITSRSFAVRRKGFDPDEVRAYLGQLAEVISRLTTERDGARGEVSRLEAVAEARPEIDEDQLTAVLGEETARVLSSARRAATEIQERAEEAGARIRREAAEEAGEARRRAEEEAARLRDEAATVRLEADEARRAAIEQAEAAAARLRTQAEEEAATLRAAAEEHERSAAAAAEAARVEAEADASRIRAEAEGVLAERTAEAEEAARAVRERGEADAAGIRETAQADAAATRAAAESEREARRDEGREMVAEAQRVRERMLSDLGRRRKAARVQLEQLQAGRDRLLESLEAVQREVEAATQGLRGALPEARQVAESARVRAEAEPADTVEQLEAQIEAARSAGLPLVAPAEVDGEGDADPVDLTDAADGADEAEVDLTDDVGDDLDLTDRPGPGEPEGAVPAGDTAPGDDAASGDAAAPGDVAAPEAAVAPSDAAVEPSTDAAPEPQPDAVPDPTPEVPAQAATDPAEAPADVAADDAVEGTAEDGEEVDELFARLRASREVSVEEAREVLEGPAGPAVEDVSAEAADPEAADAGAPDDVPPEEPDRADGSDGTEPALRELLERRDGAIEPIEGRVARRLKRVLADEQGRVLDGVRRARGAPVLDEILPLDEQVRAYAEAVEEDLVGAAEEGAAFEGASLPSSASLAAVAEELGRSLAGVVRPRVERCFESGEDAEDTSDRLRATYREWKTDSLVEATRHHVLAAFGEGQGAVRPAGAPVRWVPDPGRPACPDCEDDALAGPLPSGDPFPTGHAHPPAHPGCRCLVIGERVGAPA